jgi:hypothetical protein
MQTITTIGLDIAKSVFRFMALMPAGGGYSPPVETSPCSGVLPETTAVPDWHRGLRLVSLLVARTSEAWPYRAIDATSLLKTLRHLADLSGRANDVCSRVPAQPVDATQALNLSAGVSKCKVSGGRSLS